jgi:hypothetical protein
MLRSFPMVTLKMRVMMVEVMTVFARRAGLSQNS